MPEKVDRSISLLWGNVIATVLAVPIFVLIVYIYISLWGVETYYNSLDILANNPIWVLILLIVGVIIHEVIHGLTWQWATETRVKIEYGIKWAMLTPYAHLKDAVSAHTYRIGALMPGVIVGLLPLLVALVTGNPAFFWFGLVFTIAAGGDLLVLWQIRRVPPHILVEDHPERIGCYVYSEDKQAKDSIA